MDAYPEHAKLSRVMERSQAIGEFLHWLCYERHIQLCSRVAGQYQPVQVTMYSLLADYFGIDQEKLDREKDQILAAVRAKYPDPPDSR